LGQMLRHRRLSLENRCKRDASSSPKPLDRTQEVAGSSPASSMKVVQTRVLWCLVGQWRSSSEAIRVHVKLASRRDQEVSREASDRDGIPAGAWREGLGV
jgi:hypothetical protein